MIFELPELLSPSSKEQTKSMSCAEVHLGGPLLHFPLVLNDTVLKINEKQKAFPFQSLAKQHYGGNIKQQGPTNYRPVSSPQRQI